MGFLVSWFFGSSSNSEQNINSTTNSNTSSSSFLQRRLDHLAAIASSSLGKNFPVLKEQFKAVVMQRPHPTLEELYGQLSSLLQNSETLASISSEQKAKLIQNLKSLQESSSDILKGTLEVDGSAAQINQDQIKTLNALITAFESDETPSPEKINPVLEIVIHFMQLQAGLLELVQEAFKTRFIPQIQKLFGVSQSTANLKEIEATRKLRRELRAATSRPKIKKKAPDDRIGAIGNQIAKLKELSPKMILTRLIFPEENFSKIFPELLQTAEQFKAKNHEISDMQAFQEALTTKFNEQNGSFLRRFTLLFHLKFTSAVLQFYINHSLEQFRSDLTNFLLKKPDDRMEDAFSLLIRPLKNHLSTFQSELQAINESKNVLPSSVEDVVTDFFTQKLYIDGKSKTDHMNTLASILVEKYAPTFSLTTRVKETLNAVFPPTNYRVVKAFLSCIKGTILGITYFLIWPFEWLLNHGVKYMLRKIMTRSVLPAFFDYTQNALKESSYQHAINQFLQEKLENFNRHISEAHSNPPIALQSDVTRQHEMKGFIDHFFKTIPLQQAMNDPTSLKKYLDNTLSPENIKLGLNQLIIDEVTPTISRELLKILENFLQEELLSEFVWYAFDNFISTVQNPPAQISATEKQTTETAMIEELEEAVTSAVEVTVRAALDPSKKLNEETAADITELQLATLNFVESCKNINNENFKSKNDEWQQLSRKMTNLMEKFAKTKVGTLINLAKKIGEGFKKAAENLSVSMQEMQRLQEERTPLKKNLEILKERQAYFKHPLTTSQIFAGLTMLDSSIDATLLKDFKHAITRFLQITKEYKALPKPNLASTSIFQAELHAFNKALDSAFENASNLITQKSSEMDQHLKLTEPLEALKTWANTLKPISVPPIDVTPLQMIGQAVGDSLQKYLVNLLMSYVSAVLNMKAKPYHWNAVMWRIVCAYLKMPSQSVKISFSPMS